MAEALQWQTEKFLAESGDKLPQSAKDEVNEALSDLRGALGGIGHRADQVGARAARPGGAEGRLHAVRPGRRYGRPRVPAPAGRCDVRRPARAGGEDVVDAEVVDEDDKK